MNIHVKIQARTDVIEESMSCALNQNSVMILKVLLSLSAQRRHQAFADADGHAREAPIAMGERSNSTDMREENFLCNSARRVKLAEACDIVIASDVLNVCDFTVTHVAITKNGKCRL